jgi:hypothetical protein
MFYVKRVRVRDEVRGYSLITFRKGSPSRAMFRLNHPSLDRCITLGAIMRAARFGVSFPVQIAGAVSHKPFHSPR